MRVPRPFVLLVALSFAFSCSLFAQTESATLSGHVTDPSGAALVGAQVQVVNLETNVAQSTQTNNAGLYLFSSLQPGQYRMSVKSPGFKESVKQAVVLHVQDTLAQNFKMEIGSASESITVAADSSLVQTESAAVATVIDRQFVDNIPLNGRSFQTLLTLTPGIVLTPPSASNMGQFSVNGQRTDANYFTVDGVSANNSASFGATMAQTAGGSIPGLTASGGTQSLVSVDAMQEFRIQTSSFAPEYGRSPGAQVSIVTRSGVNQWHGTIFDYFRNDVLDANDWFNNRAALAKPKERQNDFGGTFSGPIFHNRTFFFFSYEGLRFLKPQTLTSLVPSTAARAAAPASVQPLMQLFPTTTAPDLGNGTSSVTFTYSDPSTINAYSGRVDHTFNSRLSLFGRYSDTPSSNEQHLGSPTNIFATHTRTRTMTLGLNASLSPWVSNEFRANLSNVVGGSEGTTRNFSNATPPSVASLLTLNNSPFGPEDTLYTLSITGLAQLRLGNNAISEQRQLNFLDNVSLIAGPHHLKFGVDYRWLAPIMHVRPYSALQFFTSVTGGAGSMLSGLMSTSRVQTQQPNTFLSKNFSLYGQDTWNVMPRLALTYGLRWDVNPPITSKDPLHPFYTVLNLDNPANLTLAPPGTPYYDTTYGNVAPRVGVAYVLNKSLKWQSVLRGGVGLFYDYDMGANSGLGTGGFPFFVQKNLPANTPFPFTAAQAAAPALVNTPPVSTVIFVADPHLQLPKTVEWNVAVEQGLGKDQTVSITYVGAAADNLIRTITLSRPNANFTNNVTESTNSGNSNYNSLQIKYQRRMSHGLQALAAYTWSHALDNASDGSLNTTPNAVANDYAAADFDIRQQFTEALTYDIPFRSGRTPVHAIFGGWSVDDFLIARSAPPVDILASTVVASGDLFNQRPNVIAGQPFYIFGPTFPGGKAFNNVAPTAAQVVAAGCVATGAKGAFCVPTAGQGNFPRNALRGFGAWQMDLSVRRRIVLYDRLNMQFVAQAFNIFNHTNFGSPSGVLPLATFVGSPGTELEFAL